MELYSDQYFMNLAFQEAEAAFERDEIPVGAVIVTNNKVIARSHNLTQTLTDVTAHAEMQAITSASSFLGGKYLRDCTLYVTLEPCNMCAGALYWSQISRVIFAAEDTHRGYRKFNTPLHPKTKVAFGLMAERSTALIQSFFESKR
ncbi:nucleoside deaminase [Flavobacteriaceae bacterium Ap0902]|nr:nucleoside deaminase [Flavobacteriaceae bacterium Ap0902]